MDYITHPPAAWLAGQALQGFILAYTAYHLLIGLAGLRRQRPAALPFADRPRRSFAVVVPAHNEEAVIGALLDSLAQLRYPRHLYDVYVVADNCADATAAVARARGARVFERRGMRGRGKGYALRHAFRRILTGRRRYDALAVFDADNLVAPDFLLAMNARLARGQRLVQGYLDVKNPDDTWVSASYALSYWVSNRFFFLARERLGLPVQLGGTGMCIAAETLRELGWDATGLTEDLEFTMKGLLRGIRTRFAPEAVVYDEKPLAFGQSWRQRLRWLQGGMEVAARYFWPLLWRGLRERRLVLLDGGLQLLRPFALLAAGFVGLMGMAMGLSAGWPVPVVGSMTPFWWVVGAIQYSLPLFVLWLDRLPARPYRFLPLFPLFAYSWLPLAWLAALRYVRRAFSRRVRPEPWTHTLHTRSISYQELRARRSVGLGG